MTLNKLEKTKIWLIFNWANFNYNFFAFVHPRTPGAASIKTAKME